MTKSAAASHRERTNRNDVDFLINNNKILFFNNVTELKKAQGHVWGNSNWQL